MPRRERARLALALAALLALPALAEAAPALLHGAPSRASLLAGPAPLQLAAGKAGATTVGSAGASASTTINVPGTPKTFGPLLHVDSNAQGAHTAEIRLVDLTHPARVRHLTLWLASPGGPTSTQVEIESGGVLRHAGAPVRLEPGERASVWIRAAATGGPSTLHLEISLRPVGAPAAAVAYAYTLVVK